jgi:hypothetical protein
MSDSVDKEINEFMSKLSVYGRVDGMSNVNVPDGELLPDEVKIHLEDVMGKEPSLVWLEGPTRPSHKSEITFEGYSLWDQLDETGHRTIYFSAMHKNHLTSDHWENLGVSKLPQYKGIVIMLYSLVYQTFQQMECDHQTKVFEEFNLEQLDGSLASVSYALKVLEGCIKYIDGPMLWVIDGVDMVDTPKTRHYLDELYDIFEMSETKNSHQLLFTTNGTCGFLQELAKASPTNPSRVKGNHAGLWFENRYCVCTLPRLRRRDDASSIRDNSG